MAATVREGLVQHAEHWSIPYIEIAWDRYRLRFSDAGRLSRKRAGTLFTKEPTTLRWIDSFTHEDVLFDVGANCGMYTIYAAAVPCCRVYAFEPEALSYAELNKNIYLNKVWDRVRAYCLAVSDEPRVDVLWRSKFIPSFSHHDFGENRFEGAVTAVVSDPAKRLPQGCVAAPLDPLVGSGALPKPTHVKVDVDGFEWKVVAGARGVLADPTLRSILVETDFRIDKSVALMTDLPRRGWRFSWDQVCTNRHGKDSMPRIKSLIARQKGGANVIYYRDPKYDAWFRDFRPAFEPHPTYDPNATD